jgi:hypothetical protein
MRKVIICPWGAMHYPLVFQVDNTSRNIYQDTKSPWSCGPVTVVLFIQQLFSLQRDGRICFNGVRHVQRMETEGWNTFGNSCYINEGSSSKGVWWNWSGSSNEKTPIETVIMDFLFRKILKSFMDKNCCKEMVMRKKPTSYVSPWKVPFERCIENTNETVSKIKEFIDQCRK